MKWLSVVFAVASLCTEGISGPGGDRDRSCLLSDDQPYSWIVTIRYMENGRLACVGLMIAPTYVVAQMTCFQKSTAEGFHRGSAFLVNAGTGECLQQRRGKLVMGHPGLAEDRFKYNMAYLEVEPFDVDLANPPVMELPSSEKNNVVMVKDFIEDKTYCNIPTFSVEAIADVPKNQITDNQVNLISRGECWNIYCPSGNRGCIPYFWTTESYFCTTGNRELWRRCERANEGAPVVCNGTAVGLLKICRASHPPLIQGFNQEQLDAIEMYRRIAAGKEVVEEDGEEQEEPPFPYENGQDGDYP